MSPVRAEGQLRSELRSVLVNAFRSRGGTVVEIDNHYDTQTCHVCGCIDEWDAGASIFHVCSACGHQWDQDRNACQNRLGKFERSDGIVAPKAKRQAKWEGRGRRKGTARKDAPMMAE